jgi:cytochrome c oxidase assembly factor 2
MTSSLFATTLFASFFVVALPHVLPCPAPRVVFADGETVTDGPDGKRRRRRKPRPVTVVERGERETECPRQPKVEMTREDDSALRAVEAHKRECPVPKPPGVLGQWLGFTETAGRAQDADKPKR